MYIDANNNATFPSNSGTFWSVSQHFWNSAPLMFNPNGSLVYMYVYCSVYQGSSVFVLLAMTSAGASVPPGLLHQLADYVQTLPAAGIQYWRL